MNSIFYKKDANEALSIWSVEYPPMMKLIGKYKWTRSMLETLFRNKFAMDLYKMSVPSFNSSAEKSAAKKVRHNIRGAETRVDALIADSSRLR